MAVLLVGSGCTDKPTSPTAQPGAEDATAKSTVTVTPDHIRLGDAPIVVLRNGRVDKGDKQGGDETKFLIQPLFDALSAQSRTQKSTARLHRQKFDRTVTIAPHGATPFRLLTEVAYTAGMAEYSKMRLAVGKRIVRSPRAETHGVIEVEQPQLSISRFRDKKKERPLGLSLTVAETGFRLQATGADINQLLGIAPTASNRDTNPSVMPVSGVHIPKKGDDYDHVDLYGKLVLVKKAHPRAALVFLTAERRIHFRHLVHAMDAIRYRLAEDRYSTRKAYEKAAIRKDGTEPILLWPRVVLAANQARAYSNAKDRGIHKALGTDLFVRGLLRNVFGDTTGFDTKLNAAIAGAGNKLTIGKGPGGSGHPRTDSRPTQGFGRIHGLARIETEGGMARLGSKKSRKKGVRRGKGTVVGSCKEKDVTRVVSARLRAVGYCYEKVLARHPKLSGKVTVKWQFGGDGRVSELDIASDTMGHAKVTDCMKRSIQRWRFTKPKGGICQVRYPFFFTPN